MTTKYSTTLPRMNNSIDHYRVAKKGSRQCQCECFLFYSQPAAAGQVIHHGQREIIFEQSHNYNCVCVPNYFLEIHAATADTVFIPPKVILHFFRVLLVNDLHALGQSR
jgi:hypothetical protein